MLKSLLLIAGLLFVAAPAEAHRRHRHHHEHVYQVPVPWLYVGHQPKIRIDEHCVWKPWKQRLVCRY